MDKIIEEVEKFLEEFPGKALNIGLRVLLAILVWIIGVWLIKLLRRILTKSLTKAKADLGVIQFLDSFLKVALYVVLAFAILGNFGIQATSIVAIIGSAGVAIGLAMQGSLSNMAGGVLILLLKPFKVGDYIVEDSHKNEGTVQEITMFYTKLSTLDNKTVILPNGSLANTSLTNVSLAKKRCLVINVGISYQSDLKSAKELLLKIVTENQYIIAKEGVNVYVDSLGASEVNLGARLWVKNSEYWAAKWEIIETVKLEFDKNGIEIPYQQLDVHMKETNV